MHIKSSPGLKLGLSIAFCDGGTSEDMTDIQNILTDNWTSDGKALFCIAVLDSHNSFIPNKRILYITLA